MLDRDDNKEYLPIEGLPEFRKATMDLMLGPDSKAAKEVPIPTTVYHDLPANALSSIWAQ